MTDAPRTEAQTETKDARRERNNGIIVASCVTFVAAMVGASYAAVPLYDLFCRVTGYNGTTQRVEQVSDTVLDRTIKVTFDANTGGGLPWSFKPVDRDVEMRIGETVQINYRVKNLADRPTTGQATFNVTPMQGGPISTRSRASASRKRRCSRARSATCRSSSSSTRPSSTSRKRAISSS